MKFSKILLAAGALALSAFANAAPTPVNNWDVFSSGSWTAYAPNPGVTLSGDGLTLSWGTSTGQGQSSLAITNPPTSPLPNIPTWWGGGTPPAGYIAPGVKLTHNNEPITGTSLTSATLSVAMTLTPTNPSGSALPLPTINYQIKFVETPNQTPCDAPSPANNPCNDIFVQVSGFLNDTFSYDGYTYYVNAFPTSGGTLNVLPNSACAAAGVANGCIGFTTVEGGSTSLPFGITISSSPLQVPEPGSLALVGLALAGLGFVGRRRRSDT